MPSRNIGQIRTRAPFSDLFPINPHVKDAIKEDMERHGFDSSKPIDVWDGVIIDGHTRYTAAREARLQEVAVYDHEFRNDQEALEYAIHNQRDRRNLTDSDILRCVAALDARKQAGRPDKLAQGCANFGKSAEETARIVGIAPRKVEQARTVLGHADDDTRQRVLDGDLTINAAYKATQERRHSSDSRPTFNRTNDNIKWALWTWNPVTGCEHDCPYCYARDIANRFYSQGFKPTFHPDRLSAPSNTKLPANASDNIGERNVFVCSMADLFGKWVPQEWIDAVLGQVRANPQWGFIFLTKNPRRLATIDWPTNARVGTTVDTQARVKAAEEAFRNVNASIKFLSCEPLLERLTFSSLEMFDWVLVGGKSRSSQEPECQPDPEWVRLLWNQAAQAGCPIYWKENLNRPQLYPSKM